MEENKESEAKKEVQVEETMKPVLIIKKSSSKADFMEPSPKSSSRISHDNSNWDINTKTKLKTE